MCGISGYLDLSGAPADARIAEAMAEAIAHRGPDGQGVYSDGPLALGHRRLAVLDLSDAGRQPMTTPGGRFVIVYNGEVYNFLELRRELETCGHVFQSRTDTEVVLAAWAAWGPAALDRFNGMFAFAIWDREEGTLCLARDRYGIKPVYWTRTGGLVVFGSEIKALLTHPRVSASLDRFGLIEYLSFQNFFTERTLFDGIEILPAGHWLRIGRHGTTEQNRYWDWNFREEETADTEEDYIEELDRLFVQAVTRQLVADVPISSYLSGGLDSGAITAVAAQREARMRSFTIGFDSRSTSGLELATDERPEAEHMSYHFGTEHYEMVLKAGDMQRALPRMAFHIEEPRVGQSYPNFYASHLASRFGKVVLAGSGGDELFGGYPWRYYRAVVNDDFHHYAESSRRFTWRGNKTSRRDFWSLCQIDLLSNENEIVRQIRAVEISGYANAHLDVAGYRFRIEGPVPRQQPDFSHCELDFTEAAYIEVLELAADRYRFIGFDTALAAVEPSVLWRHDIDFSVHRAQRLAVLEAERGLQATYFVLPGSRFYNMFEAEPLQLLREIVLLGHHIGLHFDSATVGEGKGDQAVIEERIAWEPEVLEHLVSAPVSSVSIHNPDPELPWLKLECLGGLVNTYGAGLNEHFSYVSDSNGIWRHHRLMDVIVQDNPAYLHVLTHPGWWVPEPAPARTRVRRAIEGRARSAMQNYDRDLDRYGRPNVR